ncbi:hypothetical protein FZCC0188_11630 [Rhodobacterales bacterium FZCC0188]|nr:hypothetical protein [Rhodobacterales bacterium FZCC0188]
MEILSGNVVIGGGVVGSWLHNSLISSGRESILVSDFNAPSQTLFSQGIIHGGTKYALGLRKSEIIKNIRSMPQIWDLGFSRKAKPFLPQEAILSENQMLIFPKSLMGRAKRSLVSRAVASTTSSGGLTNIMGKSFLSLNLNEKVLDPATLLSALCQGNMINSVVDSVDTYSGIVRLRNGHTLKSNRIFVCAGAGVEELVPQIKIQKRALCMFSVRSNRTLPDLFLHYIRGQKPLFTITSHSGVWYVGGEISEVSVDIDDHEASSMCLGALCGAFPELRKHKLSINCHRVDRIEPVTADNNRPNSPLIEHIGKATVILPVKLTFTPLLSNIAVRAASDQVYGVYRGEALSPKFFPIWRADEVL